MHTLSKPSGTVINKDHSWRSSVLNPRQESKVHWSWWGFRLLPVYECKDSNPLPISVGVNNKTRCSAFYSSLQVLLSRQLSSSVDDLSLRYLWREDNADPSMVYPVRICLYRISKGLKPSGDIGVILMLSRLRAKNLTPFIWVSWLSFATFPLGCGLHRILTCGKVTS